jgi:hypothetical protein
MTVSMGKVAVALNLSRKVPELLIQSKRTIEGMTGNSWFPAPVPSLPMVQAATDKLREAEVAGLSLTRGLKSARNDGVKALVGLLNRLKAYVQGVADENPDSAASIIESAGMNVAKRTHKPKPELAVDQGPVSGSARLVARAVAKRAQYDWETSTDSGGTWLRRPNTLQAKTTVTGLVPGNTYWFRMRAVTRHGVRDWCEPVSLIAR